MMILPKYTYQSDRQKMAKKFAASTFRMLRIVAITNRVLFLGPGCMRRAGISQLILLFKLCLYAGWPGKLRSVLSKVRSVSGGMKLLHVKGIWGACLTSWATIIPTAQVHFDGLGFTHVSTD